MRTLVKLLLIMVVAVSVVPANAAIKTLAEWNFDSVSDTAGWQVGSGVDGLAVNNGNLTGRVTGGDPSVAGPQFEIAASPYQFVEIRMKNSAGGSGELFWANTTAEPYGGFRPEQFKRIEFKAGDFQVYRIFPFWQDLGKIIRLRIDPPQKSDFEIDYVRVMEMDAAPSSGLAFDFSKPGQAWLSPGTATVQGADGLTIAQPGEWMLASPRLDVKADGLPYLNLQMRSVGADLATLQWVGATAEGAKSCPLRLNPDGRWHNYNVLLGDLSGWTGTVSTILISGSLKEGQQIQIRSAGVSAKPTGPAEFQITSFGLVRPVNRIGEATPSIIKVVLMNTGGEPVKHEITARFNVSPGNKLNISERELPSVMGLKPGASVTMLFNVVPSQAVPVDVLFTAEIGDSSATASSTLRWYPPLSASVADYVPAPKSVRGDIDVGVYYFPGWSTYRAWSVLDAFPERKPLLGYYREGDPQIADWQIKWMTEHGITFIAYDWYWSAGSRSLDHALHQGLFNARYKDKIKFCLLWANHNAAGTSSADDVANVTNYWLDNYFSRLEYYKIDGKPVVIIFSPQRLTEDMGVDGVKQAFDKARAAAKARGLAGIYFMACTYPTNTKPMEQEGYDAFTGYNYPSAGSNGQNVEPYADNVKGYLDFWNRIADGSSVPYVPVTDPGWDSRPWGGANARQWTGKTTDLFKQMLENAKSFVEKHPANPKVVMAEAWNEFGEGDYIEPNAGFGFGHLDAIREVFTPAPKEHDDIVPADVGLSSVEMEKPKPATSWEFDDPKSVGWDAMMGIQGFGAANGILTMTATGNDPALTAWIGELDTSKFGSVEIRMKSDKGKQAQIFWQTPLWAINEDASVRFDLNSDGEFHVYRVDLRKITSWRSKVNALRFDPTDTAGAVVAVDYIRFLKR